MTTTFADALAEFIAASPWLGPLDAPAVAALSAMASELDAGGMTPALLSQWGLTYRNLVRRAPADAPEEDEFEAALAEGV